MLKIEGGNLRKKSAGERSVWHGVLYIATAVKVRFDRNNTRTWTITTDQLPIYISRTNLKEFHNRRAEKLVLSCCFSMKFPLGVRACLMGGSRIPKFLKNSFGMSLLAQKIIWHIDFEEKQSLLRIPFILLFHKFWGKSTNSFFSNIVKFAHVQIVLKVHWWFSNGSWTQESGRNWPVSMSPIQMVYPLKMWWLIYIFNGRQCLLSNLDGEKAHSYFNIQRQQQQNAISDDDEMNNNDGKVV